MYLFQNAKMLTEEPSGFCLRETQMQVENGRIVAVGQALVGGEVIDCHGGLLVPGLFDIHTHGAVGHEYGKATPAGLQDIVNYEARHGVTAVLASTMTEPEDWIIDSCRVIAAFEKQPHFGAHIAGIHLEGPFFSRSKCGAQPTEWLLPPLARQVRKWNEAAEGMVRLVAVAPEIDGAMDFIRELKEDFTVSVGHTAADYDTVHAAFAAGATHGTHLYNGMTGMTHRAPGVVGAFLDSTEPVTAELIGDGHHIHPSVIRNTFRLMGNRVILISDSLAQTGLPSGTVLPDLSGRPIFVQNGKATLEDGTIAGSTVPLSECVRRVIGFGIPLPDAFYAASLAPAKKFGLQEEIGGLRVGKYADFSLLDSDLTIQRVWIRGQAV